MNKITEFMHRTSVAIGLNKLVAGTRPCIRCYARTIDVAVFTMVWAAIVKLFGINISTTMNLILAISVYILFEAAFLSTIGTTLGKYLFNIRVRDLNGNKPSYLTALYRTLIIMPLYSMPIIGLLFSGYSVKKLKDNDSTIWDKGKFAISHEKIGYIRAAIILVIFTIIMSTWIKNLNRENINNIYTTTQTYANKIPYIPYQLPAVEDLPYQIPAIDDLPYRIPTIDDLSSKIPTLNKPVAPKPTLSSPAVVKHKPAAAPPRLVKATLVKPAQPILNAAPQ